ncbi:MAG: dodecin family protein [Sphingobium sp.]
MEDHVYKLVEIVGTSHKSTDDAIQNGLKRARETLRNVRWFEVVAVRGFIDRDDSTQYQATLKIGFTLTN